MDIEWIDSTNNNETKQPEPVQHKINRAIVRLIEEDHEKVFNNSELFNIINNEPIYRAVYCFITKYSELVFKYNDEELIWSDRISTYGESVYDIIMGNGLDGTILSNTTIIDEPVKY